MVSRDLHASDGGCEKLDRLGEAVALVPSGSLALSAPDSAF